MSVVHIVWEEQLTGVITDVMGIYSSLEDADARRIEWDKDHVAHEGHADFECPKCDRRVVRYADDQIEVKL